MKNVTSCSSSETAAAAVLGGFLLGSALFPSHRTRHGTAESRRQRQKRLSITAPPPSSLLSRVCAMKSVGDRTDTRRARAKTGWPYRQRADRGRSVALFERPDPQLKIVGDSGHGSLRGPSSLLLFAPCLARSSGVPQLESPMTISRHCARGSHGFPLRFLVIFFS